MPYLRPTQGRAREGATSTELDTLAQAAPATAVSSIATTTNITAVPGSFADLAAVQSYLAGANAIPNIETRLDNLESTVNTILARLRTLGLITP